jgi:hypothetical protein
MRRVYSSIGYRSGTLLVSPGVDHPEVLSWWTFYQDEFGNWCETPRQFRVKFNDGVAEVADNLGRYLLKNGPRKAFSFLGLAAESARGNSSYSKESVSAAIEAGK